MTSIIILTFNKLEYTQKCIESIRKYTSKGSYEIIVVDNNSTDGTKEWLNEQEDIKVIFNSDNLGFPIGCNQGVKIAKGSEILFLNNDVIVTPNWLEKMLDTLYSSSKIGAVGPITNSAFGQEIEVDYKSEDEINNFALRIAERNLQNNTEKKIKLVGFCLLLKRSILDEVGLLDEFFSPGNCEDDDLSLRIIKAGYELVLCKNVFMHHFGSISFQSDVEKSNNILKTNKEKFKQKWGFDLDYSMRCRKDLISLMDLKKNNMNILEVGSACGQTILEIKNINPSSNIYCIEKNELTGQVSSFFAKIIIGDVEKIELDYEEKFFDYIIIGDVFECIYDPEALLKKMRHYLKDNGELIVSIKNIQHFSIINNLLNGNWSYEDKDILHSEALRFFTKSEFEKLINSCGYRIKLYGKSFSNFNEEGRILLSKLSMVVRDKFISENFEVYQWLFRIGKDIILSEEVKRKIINELISFSKSEINSTSLIDLLINNNVTSEQAVALVIKNTTSPDKVVVSLAIELFKSEYINQGIQLLIETYKLYPESIDVICTLAYLLDITGNNDGAIIILKSCKIKNNKIILGLLNDLKENKNN